MKEFVDKLYKNHKDLMDALASDTPYINTKAIRADDKLLRYIKEMKKIEETNDSHGMIYDYGRIYNDAMNYIVVTYQTGGDKAMEIIDELLINKDVN